MIKGNFLRNHAGRIIQFEFNGHAEAGPYGSDIVCAGVSAVVISTINGLEALAGVTPSLTINEDEGGYVLCQLDSEMTQEQMNISQILLENLYLAVINMQEEYSEYIQIQTINK